MIAVIDYGAGNLRSISRALEEAGAKVEITDDPAVIASADAVVLPGVGHAGACVDRLRDMGMADAIAHHVEAGKPFLGICVGMQVMFDEQEEGGVRGLGLLPGKVRSIAPGVKIPHMGWNRSIPIASHPNAPATDDYVYFVHSFVAEPDDPSDVAAVAHYGESFPSLVARGNVWGTQYHPEKSGPAGLALIRRFVDQLGPAEGADSP